MHKVPLALLLVTAAPTTFAYNCERAETVGSAVENHHDLVIKGVVLDSDAKVGSVTFAVKATYSGSTQDRVTVYFSPSYELRPFSFKTGETFLISAQLQRIKISRDADPTHPLVDGIHPVSNMCSLRKRIK